MILRSLRSSVFAALGGLALLAGGGSARADLFMDILVGGSSILLPIADQGPHDTNAAVGAITVDVGALNAALAGLGIALEFDSAESSSNETIGGGTNTPATLTQSGAVRFTGVGGSALSVTILATDHDYLHPLAPKTMDSSASATFTNVVPGNQDAFQSFFDPTNTHFAQTIPSPLSLLLPNLARNPSSASNTASTTNLGVQTTPFALTNRSDLILGPSTSSTAQAKISFGGSTLITAVPDPASLALVALGMGGLGLAQARRRRRAA